MLGKALVGTWRYWGWLLFLSVLIFVGFLFYLRQFGEGLTITGMSRDVTWGLYIAQFTFLVGVAASAVMVVLPYYLHLPDKVEGTQQFDVPTSLGREIGGRMSAALPGYLVPRLVQETPGAAAKEVLKFL